MKLSSLSHSSLLKIFCFLKLHAIFAPIGYPLIIPIIKAKEPSPFILNIGFRNLLKKLPSKNGISVLDSNSVAIKNGKSEGTTEFAHKIRPDFAAFKLLAENIIKLEVKNIKSSGIRYFFNFIK